VTTLSIVILSWNTRDLLEACLGALYGRPRDLDYEVVVVDNASEDGSPDMVAKQFPEAVLIRNARNEGYAKGNNIGILRSRGKMILLLNSDTEVREDALEKMVGFLEANPAYGACGAQLIHPDGSIQRACMRFPGVMTALFFDTFLEKLFPKNRFVERYFMRDFDHAASIDVEQPPGACFMFRGEVEERVGLLDEDLFLFYNDVDYCKRILTAGYRIRFLAEARVMHHIGASTSKYRDFSLEWHKNRVRYYRKHFGVRGTAAAKFAAALKAVEEVIRLKRAGRGFRSPESKRIRGILYQVLKT
jgi:GT2 family glycosyltransferase